MMCFSAGDGLDHGVTSPPVLVSVTQLQRGICSFGFLLVQGVF